MIATISPASVHLDETLNTLKYANRAKNIKNKVCLSLSLSLCLSVVVGGRDSMGFRSDQRWWWQSHSNVRNVAHHITEYQKIISDLRMEISELKGQLMNPRGTVPVTLIPPFNFVSLVPVH
jgi:hypothetical protein